MHPTYVHTTSTLHSCFHRNPTLHFSASLPLPMMTWRSTPTPTPRTACASSPLRLARTPRKPAPTWSRNSSGELDYSQGGCLCAYRHSYAPLSRSQLNDQLCSLDCCGAQAPRLARPTCCNCAVYLR